MEAVGKNGRASQAWADYWDRHGADSNRLVGGARHGGLFDAFWRETLSGEFEARSRVRVLDAACGDGAVARLCAQLAGDADGCAADLHASDFSPGALTALEQRQGAAGIKLVAADACRLPYADGSFDMVTSQCGLEYAGHEAFSDAARLVAPAGRMLAVIHRTDGVIFDECTANLAILDRLDNSGVMSSCRRLFELQRKLLAGQVVPRVVARASGKLGLALTRLTDAVQRAADGAARSHALRLLADLGTLQVRHAAYPPDQIEPWLDTQAGELIAFRQRMQSMLDAAADEPGLSRILERLDAAGLGRAEIGEIRATGIDPPLAWTLSAAAA
ncbi:class I SAM-dependent methyltransferase [Maricaulis sp.]|uniref:class I SAM-dependent methyltransferase n=1 Tax=Maricaulis sp. TaxID=1486257 RepID=UPI003A92316F